MPIEELYKAILDCEVYSITCTHDIIYRNNPYDTRISSFAEKLNRVLDGVDCYRQEIFIENGIFKINLFFKKKEESCDLILGRDFLFPENNNVVEAFRYFMSKVDFQQLSAYLIKKTWIILMSLKSIEGGNVVDVELRYKVNGFFDLMKNVEIERRKKEDNWCFE